MKGFFKYIVIFIAFSLSAERIKDITEIKGLPKIHAVGYGLVVGLKGTGDHRLNTYTIHSIVNMLKRFGISVSPQHLTARNAAACIVTAEIPPFAKINSRIDVRVSSMGDARSLEGGVLLMTPLMDETGEICCIAQGPLTLSENIKTTGYIPNGGIIVKTVVSEIGDTFSLILRQPDLTTARNLRDVINAQFPGVARLIDPAEVRIIVPPPYRGRGAAFLAVIETLNVVTDEPAVVVINQRTGTVISGRNVVLSPCCIAHNGLKIEILPQAPVPPGSLYVVSRHVMAFEGATTVGDVANALNKLGAKPEDIIYIFQAMKRAGVLKAKLIIM